MRNYEMFGKWRMRKIASGKRECSLNTAQAQSMYSTEYTAMSLIICHIAINQTNENLGKALTSRLIKCICIFSIYSNSTQIYALGGFWLLPVALEKFKFSEFLWY